ncbi:ATP-binding cassette domain-containing protein [Flavobacteriales bacterium]|nr:ATP-binding cassette domain-containing protein [Flavobacteriales bacterium]
MSLIELKHANIFQSDRLILKDVSFSIKPTEFVYLIGATGSGKSSLLKTLYAELPLKEGFGEVVDYQLFEIKKPLIPFLRRKIGIVFQDFQLLTDRSVRDNLEFVLKATAWKNKTEINARVEEVLKKVEMSEHIDKMPFELSGGEQQRVCIARALLNDPKLILADEPTGNLDPETTDKILNLIHDLCANGCAVLMATHEHNLLNRFASKVLKCDDGKVAYIE